MQQKQESRFSAPLCLIPTGVEVRHFLREGGQGIEGDIQQGVLVALGGSLTRGNLHSGNVVIALFVQQRWIKLTKCLFTCICGIKTYKSTSSCFSTVHRIGNVDNTPYHYQIFMPLLQSNAQQISTRIQFLRATAIIAVVFIHTCPLGIWQGHLPPFSELCRCPVPVFIRFSHRIARRFMATSVQKTNLPRTYSLYHLEHHLHTPEHRCVQLHIQPDNDSFNCYTLLYLRLYTINNTGTLAH